MISLVISWGQLAGFDDATLRKQIQAISRWSNVDFVGLMGLLYILLEVGFIYIQLTHSSTYHDV